MNLMNAKLLGVACALTIALMAAPALAGPEVGSGSSAVGSPDPSKNSRGQGTVTENGQTYKVWSNRGRNTENGRGVGSGKASGNDKGAPGGD
jgi:hypothetical protein